METKKKNAKREWEENRMKMERDGRKKENGKRMERDERKERKRKEKREN